MKSVSLAVHALALLSGATSVAAACPAGMTGPACGLDVDECATPVLANVCGDGSVCTSGTNSRSCACPPFFEGDTTCWSTKQFKAENTAMHNGMAIKYTGDPNIGSCCFLPFCARIENHA
jgi:hypothetical protein